MQDRSGGIREPALGATVGYFLKVARDPRERAAGTGCAREPIEAPGELRPQLRPSRLDVRAPVGGVVKLVGPDGVVDGFWGG